MEVSQHCVSTCDMAKDIAKSQALAEMLGLAPGPVFHEKIIYLFSRRFFSEKKIGPEKVFLPDHCVLAFYFHAQLVTL